MSTGRLSGFPRASRRSMGLAAAVTMACGLAACGGGSDTTSPVASTQTGGSTATANAFTLTGEWPLTGQALSGSPPDHPVYVVKIDNTSNSQPQIGLGSADMVVEELVEGGLTRLAAFFYSDIPGTVGPVRSMRASDVGIVKPADADLVASGGAKKTIRIIDGHHISAVTEDAGSSAGFYRDDSRTAPYNLFIKLTELASGTTGPVTAPAKPYLPFGDADDFTGTVPATSIAATFSGAQTTTWSYTDKGWIRQNSLAQTGDDFVADNVLLLRVKVGDAGYLDPAGNPVPETEFFGKGRAVLVHGDSALPCTWHKKDKSAELTLTDNGGTEVTVPAGHTWIELVPAATGNVTIGK